MSFITKQKTKKAMCTHISTAIVDVWVGSVLMIKNYDDGSHKIVYEVIS